MKSFQLELDVCSTVGYTRGDDDHLAARRRQVAARLLYHVRRYYSVFSKHVAEKLRVQRAPIEEKLQNFGKLSRWDIGDYNHLVTTTEKSHRTLTKCARDYDNALLMRAAVELQVKEDGWEAECDFDSPSGMPDPTAPPLQLPAWAGQAAPLPKCVNFPLTGDSLVKAGLSVLINRMRKFRVKDISPDGAVKPLVTLADGVDEVRQFLITRAGCWRDESVKRMIQQKALTDMLKLLAECGLSHLTTARDADQLDIAAMFSTLPTGSTAHAAADGWANTDDMFYHCVARMVSLRAGEGSGKDVTRRERLRAIGLAEHLLTLVTRSRTALDTLACQLGQLEWSATALGGFSNEPSGTMPRQVWLLRWVWNAKELCDDTCEAFAECRLLGDLAAGATSRSHAPPASLERAAEVALACKRRMDQEAQRATWLAEGQRAPILLSQATLCVVEECLSQLGEVARSLMVEVSPRLDDTTHSCLVSALRRIEVVTEAWHSEHTPDEPTSVMSEEASLEVAAAMDSVLASLLVAFQKLRRIAQDVPAPTAKPLESKEPVVRASDLPQQMLVDAEGADNVAPEEEEDGGPVVVAQLLLRSVELSSKLGAALALPKLNASMSHLFDAIARHAGCSGMEWVEIAMCQLRGALKEIAEAAQSVVAGGLKIHHEMCRLEHTLVSLFQQLFARGFAKKPEDDNTEDGERGTEDVDGTGMGDGSGVKDVSQELENEEQLEGLKEEQKEKQEKEEQEEGKEDEGVEMTNDFEGEMEDYKPPPDEEGKDEDEQEDEKEEVDRDMGDIGDDGEVVDQKAWDPEEDDEKDMKDQKEKTEKDSNMDGKDEDVEIQAKEDPDAADDDGGNKDKQDKQKDDQKQDQKPEDAMSDDEAEASDEEDGGGNDDKVNDGDEQNEEKSGVEVREEEDFQLPEDMDLEEQEGEIGEDGEDGEEGEGEEDMPEASEVGQEDKRDEDAPEDGGMDGEDGDAPPPDPMEEDGAAPEEEGGGGGGDKMEEDEDEATKEEEPEEDDMDTAAANAAPENERQNNPFGVQDDKKKSNDTIQGADEAPDQSKGQRTEAASAQQQGQSADQDEAAPAGQSADQQDDDAGASGEGRMDANPMRSLGQVAKHWERKLNVQDRGENPPPPENQEKQEDVAAQYEFMGDDDEGEEDTQVLAPATDSQAGEQAAPPSMPEEMEQKQTDDDQKKDREQRMQVDEEEAKKQEQQRRSGAGETKPREKGDEDEPEDVPEEEADDEAGHGAGEAMELEPGVNEFSVGVLEPRQAASQEADLEEQRAEIERLMQQCREGQASAETSDDIWRNLESLTGEYSRELCEMLRLVLEPTLATRLQGGYRTGKRIDMKKVIPYIASDFRKDRIWMRRTKPSKRTYQVMVAVDSSRSMQQNHAGQLALEALVLISRALARLEVGDFAALDVCVLSCLLLFWLLLQVRSASCSSERK